jgi:carboxynorspermidine decarboxylase
VILEPGAGLVVDTGYLVATVLDTMKNGSDIAILDTSASTHMPDVLEVPYRPDIIGAGDAGEKAQTYILGGKTCMTGDVIGTYSFDQPLKPGDRLVFTDMMQYSFVKNTTFNGAPLPDLAMLEEDGTYRVVKRFGYQQFRERLG